MARCRKQLPMLPLCLLPPYRRLIKLLQGTLACNAMQFMSDVLQIEREGEERKWEAEREILDYDAIFDVEFLMNTKTQRPEFVLCFCFC